MSDSTIPAAVLDTNLIISGAITPHGVPNQVLRALQCGAFTLVSSPDLADEVADVLDRSAIRERYQLHAGLVTAVIAALQARVVRRCRSTRCPFTAATPKTTRCSPAPSVATPT